MGFKRFAVESDWRNETLRTNLWLIPAVESVAAVLLFVLTLSIDHAAFHRQLSLPAWVISGSPDAAREILAALAGARTHARTHARTRATLDTSGLTFAAFLVGVIVIVGGLIYFPMLILGPIGERIVG